jgi:hypothetical protein
MKVMRERRAASRWFGEGTRRGRRRRGGGRGGGGGEEEPQALHLMEGARWLCNWCLVVNDADGGGAGAARMRKAASNVREGEVNLFPQLQQLV